MTIITFKDGILASDSLATANDKHIFKAKKIYIIKNCAYGFAGNLGTINAIVKFLKGKSRTIQVENEKGNTNVIKIDLKTKKIYCLEVIKTYISEIEVLDNILSIGYGMEYAKGAMEMGASAIRAVKIACKYTFCQPPIHYIDINSEKPKIIEYKEMV